MTKFEGCYLTNEGRDMVYNIGLNNITFTKAVTGAGLYTSKEEISGMTALKDQKQEFGLDSLSKREDTTVAVKFKINNTGLNEGYQLSEIGIYAKPDDGEEKLYCVAYAMHGQTEEIPADDGAITYFMAVDIETIVSADANVSIVYSVEHEWAKTYIDDSINNLFNEISIEKAFDIVFTKTGVGSGIDETALSAADIDKVLTTEWNGETSNDDTAISSSGVDEALSVEWNGETSNDDTALSASDVKDILQ